MFRAAAIAAAVLFGAPTLACAQGASLGTDASSVSRNATPASAAASGFAIDEKGVKQTGNPSVGKAGTVTLGEGAAPQSGRIPSAGGQALGAVGSSGCEGDCRSRRAGRGYGEIGTRRQRIDRGRSLVLLP